MTGLLSRVVLELRRHGSLPSAEVPSRERETVGGPEAASTMILLIFAGRLPEEPERHEVDPSGAASF